jgi:hypothetical protein
VFLAAWSKVGASPHSLIEWIRGSTVSCLEQLSIGLWPIPNWQVFEHFSYSWSFVFLPFLNGGCLLERISRISWSW